MLVRSLVDKHNTDTATSFATVIQFRLFPPERAARRIHFKRSTVHHLATVESAPHNMLTLATFRGGTIEIFHYWGIFKAARIKQ